MHCNKAWFQELITIILGIILRIIFGIWSIMQKLQEILNKIMQIIMGIITSSLISSHNTCKWQICFNIIIIILSSYLDIEECLVFLRIIDPLPMAPSRPCEQANRYTYTDINTYNYREIHAHSFTCK